MPQMFIVLIPCVFASCTAIACMHDPSQKRIITGGSDGQVGHLLAAVIAVESLLLMIWHAGACVANHQAESDDGGITQGSLRGYQLYSSEVTINLTAP